MDVTKMLAQIEREPAMVVPEKQGGGHGNKSNMFLPAQAIQKFFKLPEIIWGLAALYN